MRECSRLNSSIPRAMVETGRSLRPAELSRLNPSPHPRVMKIGIDLGTTNSALAYIDEREAEHRDFPPIHIFETPQLVAPGRIEPRRTLPSFLFLEDGQPVGVYA